jgi:glycine/D-amino acid oxidase-like deaminating enzyme/nitrite reductase/ring-hydroxylating ferredoxin subunit
MSHHAHQTQAVWGDVDHLPTVPLPDHATADVCIVGGGIAGMSTAYHLLRAGLSVIVLEAEAVGSGETGRTTAHLSNAIDDRYIEIERIHGEAGARAVAESHTAAIERIREIVRDEGIPCDFERVDGYLILSPSDSPDLLDQELVAARRAGLVGVDLLPHPPLADVKQRCLRFRNQAQVHPAKYLSGLMHAVLKRGGRIHTATHVTHVEGAVEGASMAQILTRDGPIVRANAVVIATNTPINDRVTIHTKQAAYRTYALAAPIRRGSVFKALYWDTTDPYHYVRLQPRDGDTDFLIIGGEDHKTGQADDTERRHARLVEWARTWFPAIGPVEFAWSGQIIESVDGLAYIGRNPGDAQNVYIATGDSGMGMTHGTIAGMLLTDLICGRENGWAELYAPARVRLHAVSDLVQENANAAAQYADWFTQGDTESIAAISPGEGAVIRQGLEKAAVYRDEGGQFHVRSAVCPHLNCLVAWNTEEKTWDCPCHGSRFDCYGHVLNGPANADLTDVRLKSLRES